MIVVIHKQLANASPIRTAAIERCRVRSAASINIYQQTIALFQQGIELFQQGIALCQQGIALCQQGTAVLVKLQLVFDVLTTVLIVCPKKNNDEYVKHFTLQYTQYNSRAPILTVLFGAHAMYSYIYVAAEKTTRLK